MKSRTKWEICINFLPFGKKILKIHSGVLQKERKKPITDPTIPPATAGT